MKNLIPIIVAAGGASLIAVWLYRNSLLRQRPTASDGAMAELRAMSLALTPEGAGIKVPETGAGVWGAVVDWSLARGSATFVYLSDGAASIYYSSGGGVLGGQAHESVRLAGAGLLTSCEQLIDEFSPSAPVSLPAAGNVRFYVHSRRGLLATRELSASDLESGDQVLTPAYKALHAFITQMRLVSPAPGA